VRGKQVGKKEGKNCGRKKELKEEKKTPLIQNT
jgi:hypothetical protein